MSTQTARAFEAESPAVTFRGASRVPLVRWFWALCTLLAAVEAWLARFDMYSDGVSYLDLSDAFRTGHWQAAVNAYWSPLYPFLLGMASAVFRPTPYWEFPVVHLVNFLVFLAALGSFHYFFSGFSRLAGGNDDQRLDLAWVAFGYALFLWSSLKLISISVVSPDMLVAVFALLAAGMLARIVLVRKQGGAAGWGAFALLGVVLGLGYLAKAPMLPIGLAFLVCAVAAAGISRASLLQGALALGVLVMVAAPFIMA